jgi:hypothetical protein
MPEGEYYALLYFSHYAMDALQPVALTPASREQLRSDGVLRHEAVVVERLEQRDLRNPLFLQQIAQMIHINGAGNAAGTMIGEI